MKIHEFQGKQIFRDAGVAVLDGLGGVGEGPHAVHEHIIAAELPRRVGLLASLLMSS